MSDNTDGDFEAAFIRTMHEARADRRVTPWPDAVTRVRAAARRQTRTRSTATAVGMAGLLGVTAAGVLEIQHTRASATLPDGAVGGLPASGSTAPSPVVTASAPRPSTAPGSSVPSLPDNVELAFGPVTSGADWVLTVAQYQAFQATHPSFGPASPPPVNTASPSPGEVDLASQALAVLPAGTTPYPGLSIDRGPLWGRAVEKVDGQMVVIDRSSLAGPHSDAELGVAGVTPTLSPDKTAVWTVAEQVPSSGGALVPGHLVLSITSGGIDTTWTAPDAVPVAQLLGWVKALAVAPFGITAESGQPTLTP